MPFLREASVCDIVSADISNWDRMGGEIRDFFTSSKAHSWSAVQMNGVLARRSGRSGASVAAMPVEKSNI